MPAASPTNLQLMVIRADTDFTYDARGRMRLTNEPREADRRPAPRLFLGSTNAGHVVRFGEAVPDAIANQITDALSTLPSNGGLRVAPATLAQVQEMLGRHAPITAVDSGPAYRFPETVGVSADAVQITTATCEAVRSTYPWLYDEYTDWWPCFAAVRDDAAVSVCFSSRISDAAAAAGVETLPAFRGRGLASVVTAAWGVAVRASGRIPLYSTSWDNLASQGVARRLHLVQFGADITWA